MTTARAWAPPDSRARRRDAVVADHRRREADDLLGVARVGDDLLVAGHRGREDGLAEREALGADRLAAEDGPVLEGEEAGHDSYTTRPAATSARTLPRSVSPSSHELTERERKPSSLTRQLACGVEQDEVRRRADRDPRRARARRRAPARPTSARAASRAGAGPARRGACRATANAVSSPVTPNGASSNGTSFSCRACGAWSVATQQIVPSRSAVDQRLRGRPRSGAAGSSSRSRRASAPPRR